MAWIESEQLTKAKSVDLYSYLTIAEPHNMKRRGQDEYCLKDHDSLKVSVSTGKWHWHSRGFGGTTAVQYLIAVRGYTLPEAALMVLESRATPYTPLTEPPPARPFVLPNRHTDNERVLAYLCGKRGLHHEVVERCIALGTLYESAPYHSCVLVGCDEAGTPRHAAIRATGGDFKQDIEGSDKRHTFAIQAQNTACAVLCVYEGAIDALSGASLHLMGGEAWKDAYYLSLASVSILPIIHYLQIHPAITTMRLCLDNDEAGRLAAERIKSLLHVSRPSLEIVDTPPKIGKDYNECLCLRLAPKRRRRKALSRGSQKHR